MAGNLPSGSSGKPLHRMFTDIPDRYDLINHVITLGMDRSWREKAARRCLSSQPHRILDICCGTGDLTVLLATMADYPVEITGVDYSKTMLEVAEQKAVPLRTGKNIKFMEADVSQLPFPNSYFDCVGISFAFRNLTYQNPLTPVYLSEILRVLRSGGEFVIVETSQPKMPLIRFFFHLYLRCFVFPAGYLISGKKAPYKYLAQSAEHFYSAEEAQTYLVQCGFSRATYQRIFFGAAAIYVAVK